MELQPFVLFCFFLSGVAALALEIAWTRMLEQIFGVTTFAVSTVLTCFMGGMALGSWLFGRFAHRVRSPLLVYGLAEGLVGLSALLVPLFAEALYPEINRFMVIRLEGHFLSYSLFRFAAAGAVLLVPATCMGATLPLLCQHLAAGRSPAAPASPGIGLLYASNTLGAVAGVFLTTFGLLPGLGLAATNRAAAGINLSIAFAVAVLPRYLPFLLRSVSLGPIASDRGASDFRATFAERAFALAAFFLSGVAAMNLEVLWNRLMAIVIGGSVYAFALVLMAFLLGLSLGALAFSRSAARAGDPLFALAALETAVAASVMGSYLAMDALPRLFALFSVVLSASPLKSFVPAMTPMFAIVVLAVFPATFFMGAAFPFTVRIVSRLGDRVAHDVGSAYALNTIGAILGSFASAFVFIPVFSRYFDGRGVETAFFVSLGIYAALGAALAIASRRSPRTRFAACACLLALALGFFRGAPSWDPAKLTAGVFRPDNRKAYLSLGGDPGSEIRYYYDGVATTVSVERWGDGQALKNNGKVDASSTDDMPTQIMVSALPLLFHPAGPDRARVAMIGFGSGVSAGAALEFPIGHLTVIELEDAVVRASRFFGRVEGEAVNGRFDVNHLVYRNPIDPGTGEPNPVYDPGDPNSYVRNPRLDIVSDDGRNVLAASPGRYDVIISEPSNPWLTGVSNLFTLDNFLLAKAALRPGGIFCQWIQLYEISSENVEILLRTFARAFPHVAVFLPGEKATDIIALGSLKPIAYDFARLSGILEDGRIQAELARAYVFSPADLLARALLLNREELSDCVDGPGRRDRQPLPVNTDDNALIEFRTPLDLLYGERAVPPQDPVFSRLWRYGALRRMATGYGTGPERAQNLAEQAVSLLEIGRKDEALLFLDEAERLDRDDPSVILASVTARFLTVEARLPMPKIGTIAPAETISEGEASLLNAEIAGILDALGKGRFTGARDRFRRIPAGLRTRGIPELTLIGAYLDYLIGDPNNPDRCVRVVEALRGLLEEHPAFAAQNSAVYYYLALCNNNLGRFYDAVSAMQRYIVESREIRQVKKAGHYPHVR